MHRAQVGFDFITWGEPDPVGAHLPSSKKKTRRGSDASLIAGIHHALGLDTKKLVRTDDPETSKLGAKSVQVRSGTQKYRLLVAYSVNPAGALTDDMAADISGLLAKPGCCWWHRCTDLRTDGLIEETGEMMESPLTGEQRMACKITPLGLRSLGVAT
jgi:hypothetical protein